MPPAPVVREIVAGHEPRVDLAVRPDGRVRVVAMKHVDVDHVCLQPGQGIVQVGRDVEGVVPAVREQEHVAGRGGRPLEVARRQGSPAPLGAVANELLNACRGLGIDHRDFVTVFDVYHMLSGGA